MDNAEETTPETDVTSLARHDTTGLELADALKSHCAAPGHILFVYATLMFFVNQHIFGHCGYLDEYIWLVL